jgi:hypothetical protein
MEVEADEPLSELVREHMDLEHLEKEIEVEQVHNLIHAKAHDAD